MQYFRAISTFKNTRRTVLISGEFVYRNPISESKSECVTQADRIIFFSLLTMALYAMEWRLVGEDFGHLLQLGVMNNLVI